MSFRMLAILTAALATVGVSHAAPAPPRATVETGVVEGTAFDGVLRFAGIPYAAPPVGPLRWRPPQPAKRWTGVRQATTFGNECMQSLAPVVFTPILTDISEDCLFINVWRPAKAAKPLPVLVYFYGGGFTRGGSSSVLYSGDAFAKQGVVVVSMNYRVGRFGFFGHPALTSEYPDEPKANYAFMDQIAALKWVKRNVASFGGDPNNVTIGGESAGGGSVHAMMVSPLARGLFQRAIIESAGPPGRNPAQSPRLLSQDLPNKPSLETIGVNFAKTKGIEGVDALALARLRALPADEIVDLPGGGGDSPTWSGQAIDGKVIVESPAETYRAGRQARVPLLTGANADERGGGAGGNNAPVTDPVTKVLAKFAPSIDEAVRAYDPEGTGNVTEMARKVSSDNMAEAHRFAAAAVSSQGQPVYEYRWDYRTEALADRWRRGAPHASELAYVFDVIGPYYGPAGSDRDRKVAKTVNTYFSNFVKTGDPNGADLPRWPRYDPRTDHLLFFHPDGTAGDMPDPWKARMDLTAASAEAGR